MNSIHPKFYSSVYSNPSDIISKFQGIDSCAFAEAGNILRGRIKLLRSEPFVFLKKIDWNLDPLTKRKWRLFRGRPYLLTKEENRDLKYVFELNRQQYLFILGKAYFFSEDKALAKIIYDHIDSWIMSNPIKKTVNWLSPLELSIRIVSWLWAILIINRGQINHFVEGNNGRIIASIYEQINYVEKNLQKREYPNNHLIGEVAGLVIVAIMFPGFSESRRWLEKGLEILSSQIKRQVFSDGIDKEQALDYHRFVLDFYTHVVILCHRNNVVLPDHLLQKLEKMYEALLYVVRPDGFGPMVGDDDNGRVATLSSDSGRFLLSALSTGAVLFERGDFKYVAKKFHEESLWLLGLDGYCKFKEIAPEKPHSESFYFSKSGLFVMRSQWDRCSHYLSFDCGVQGMGTAGHGHADGLSFEFSAFSIPLLLDPGTYVYNGSRRWRDYFRGTAAHNTIVVDGLNQSSYIEPYDEFGWKNKADCQVTSSYIGKEFDFVSAYHDGYNRLPDPVRHTRLVLFIKHEYWIITDMISGQKMHSIEWPLHFVENVTIHQMDKGVFEIKNKDNIGVILNFTSDSEYKNEIIEGSQDPIQGWVSYRYGDKTEAKVLNFAALACLPMLANTILIPFKDHKPEVHFKQIGELSSNDNQVIGLEIIINEAKDIYFFSTGKMKKIFSGFETDAETILARFDKNGLLWKCFMKNGSYLIHDDIEIFRLIKPEHFFVWQPADRAKDIELKLYS